MHFANNVFIKCVRDNHSDVDLIIVSIVDVIILRSIHVNCNNKCTGVPNVLNVQNTNNIKQHIYKKHLLFGASVQVKYKYI